MTVSNTKPNAKMKKIADEIRKCALAYPGAHEDAPWGHAAFKVGKKVFLFMGVDADGLGTSTKLDRSRFEALELPFTEPTHYGLGKHGWVSASFKPNDRVPTGLLEQWIDESYRLIAPKKLIKELDGDTAPTTAKKKTSRSRRSAKATRKAT